MTVRDELTNALARRHRVGTRDEKTRILDEYVSITVFNRKHAMRLLRSGVTGPPGNRRVGRGIYGEAVREALVVLWEASDRICGRPPEPLIPVLVEAMERHGHLRPGPEIRAGLLAMGAATIDRSLRETRDRVGGQRSRHCAGAFPCARSRTGTIRRPDSWRPIWWRTAVR